MAVFAPGAWAGVNDAFVIARQKEQEQQRLAESRQRMARDAWEMQTAQEDRTRAMRARGDAGSALYRMMPPGAGAGAPPQGPAPQPPMPGTPSQPMQPPGGGGQRMLAPGVPQFSAPPQGAAPQGAGGQPPGMRGAPAQPDERTMAIMRCRQDLQALDRELAAPGLNPDQRAILTGEKAKAQDQLAKLTGQPAPYRTVPQAGEQLQGAPGGPTPAGPMAPPAVGSAPQGAQGGQPQSLLMQIVQGAKANGVPPDRLMDVVDTLNPVLKSQLSEELAQLRASQVAQSGELRAIALGLQAGRDSERGRHNEVTEGQGDRRLDQNAERNRQRASAAANAKDWKEYRDGETVYRDSANAGVTQRKVNGKWEDVDQLPAGATPASKAGAQSQAQAVRASLVKAGVTNSLARLDEIEKKYPKMTTSAMFGQHPDGPVSGAMYGVGRAMQGKQQQAADAAWSSFIDEAMPVFTGGLRASDSFRKFLAGQAPQPGDKPEVVAEKMRLLRANINGSSKAFFNKFNSDPKMRASDEKPASGGSGWKVEKVED